MTRRFADEVSIVEIERWCDLARRAPSAGFAQGVHFLIRSDVRATLSDLGSLDWWSDRQPGVLDASAVVVVLADPSAYRERYGEPDKREKNLDDTREWRVPYWLTDAAMAVQNLLLVIEDGNQGALFAGLFRDPRPALRSWGVPDEVDSLGMVFVGGRHPDDRPSGSPTRRSRRSRNETIHLDRWS